MNSSEYEIISRMPKWAKMLHELEKEAESGLYTGEIFKIQKL